MFSMGKFQARGSLLKILAEQLTKQAARRDESFPVVREMEPVSPGFLFRRKRQFQLAEGICIAVEGRVPNVNPVPDLFPFHHRHGDSRPLGTLICRLALLSPSPIRRFAFPGQALRAESTLRAKTGWKPAPALRHGWTSRPSESPALRHAARCSSFWPCGFRRQSGRRTPTSR